MKVEQFLRRTVAKALENGGSNVGPRRDRGDLL